MWVHGYTHTHPYTLLPFLITAQLSPVLNPLFTFLKTATIPTYYGIPIAIPIYIAMQLSTVPLLWHASSLSYCFAWSCSGHRICGKATIHNSFIHVTLDSLHIPVHRRMHSHSHILFWVSSCNCWVIRKIKVWWSSLLEHCPMWGKTQKKEMAQKNREGLIKKEKAPQKNERKERRDNCYYLFPHLCFKVAPCSSL